MRLVVAITGASGMPLAERLLEVLRSGGNKVTLVVSNAARKVIEHESDMEKLESCADTTFREDDHDAPISSGSFPVDGMVIVPCSMKTLACIANGIEENLIARAALVCLKQGRKLILVPRETPLAEPHVLNMLRASRAGAVVLPPVLTFYHNPRSVQDLIDFVIGRVLEVLGIEHDLYRRWSVERFPI